MPEIEPTTLGFGRQLIGTWFCLNDECKAQCYPNHLREQTELMIKNGRVVCPTCKKGFLVYDEAA